MNAPPPALEAGGSGRTWSTLSASRVGAVPDGAWLVHASLQALPLSARCPTLCFSLFLQGHRPYCAGPTLSSDHLVLTNDICKDLFPDKTRSRFLRIRTLAYVLGSQSNLEQTRCLAGCRRPWQKRALAGGQAGGFYSWRGAQNSRRSFVWLGGFWLQEVPRTPPAPSRQRSLRELLTF